MCVSAVTDASLCQDCVCVCRPSLMLHRVRTVCVCRPSLMLHCVRTVRVCRPSLMLHCVRTVRVCVSAVTDASLCQDCACVCVGRH